MIKIILVLFLNVFYVFESQGQPFLRLNGKDFLKEDRKNFQDLSNDKKPKSQKNQLSSDKKFLYDTKGKKSRGSGLIREEIHFGEGFHFQSRNKLFWTEYFEQKDREQLVRKR